MTKIRQQRAQTFTRFIADYGMLLVLLFLCGLLSVTTYNEQYPTGEAAASPNV